MTAFSTLNFTQASVCRWEIAVIEYQVLIYCIIDSAMIPPAVLPPVLSAESRVAVHRSTARFPARSSSKTSTSLLTSQALRTSSGGERASMAQAARTKRWDVNVFLDVCPSSLSIILSPCVTVMKCFLAPQWKMKPLVVEGEGAVPGSRG